MATSNAILTSQSGQAWNLAVSLQGALTIPSGNTYTDGYKLTFTGTVVTTMTASSHKNVCIQYLDSAGAAMAITDTAQGLPWVCMQAATGSGAAAGNQASLAMKTFTHVELQCYASAAATACTAKQSGGTVLPTGAVVTFDALGVGVASGELAAAKARWAAWW